MHAHRPRTSALSASTTLVTLVMLTGLQPVAAQCTGAWQPGDGTGGINGSASVMAAWDPDGPGPLGELLVVGGLFSIADSIQASNIAAFDPTTRTWQALGSGVNNEVTSLCVDGNGHLVVGGKFTMAGGASAARIARYDGAAWHPLGAGMDSFVRSLARRSNGDIVACGTFTQAGGA
ncbi:MAG: hypothetical protein KAI24_23010, partial [Planctomycetes bacterium]|nr:hypothetical protein [Planctomycetota bacterium]